MVTKKGFKILEHTADEYLVAYGSNLEEAFENAAFAVTEVMTDTSKIDPREKDVIGVEAKDRLSLFYLWIEKILIKFEADGKLYSKFDVSKIERSGKAFNLKATVWGESYDPNKHPSRTGVKAITYHRMEILKRKDGVAIKFLLDI